MVQDDDTIAAIATAPGEAAISIVRLSGCESVAIADRIFSTSGPSLAKRNANTFARGFVMSVDGRKLDEVVALVYRSPRSYTREDVVEFQGHGGTTSARRILRAVLDAGARPAEPGEFTKRAFLSGRIDLTQAESVLDMIRSRSDRAADTAIEQLNGAISSVVTKIYDGVMEAAAWIESSLDFAEDDISHDPIPPALEVLHEAQEGIEKLLATWDEGHMLREGALVVIAGKPNAGKSSLLNALLGRERAIVHHKPGTTRDIIEESVVLDGIPLRLTDTAGLRLARHAVESDGVKRAREAASGADLVLYVMDSSRPATAADRANIALFANKKLVVVLNKVDLGQRIRGTFMRSHRTCSISIKEERGLDLLKTTIGEILGTNDAVAPHATVSERHRRHLLKVNRQLQEAKSLLQVGNPEGLPPAASLIRLAAEELGQITGKAYHSDLLNQVFSRFCIGK